jgi:hypothetical protein
MRTKLPTADEIRRMIEREQQKATDSRAKREWGLFAYHEGRRDALDDLLATRPAKNAQDQP